MVGGCEVIEDGESEREGGVASFAAEVIMR